MKPTFLHENLNPEFTKYALSSMFQQTFAGISVLTVNRQFCSSETLFSGILNDTVREQFINLENQIFNSCFCDMMIFFAVALLGM